jgi:hypothetical protein
MGKFEVRVTEKQTPGSGFPETEALGTTDQPTVDPSGCASVEAKGDSDFPASEALGSTDGPVVEALGSIDAGGTEQAQLDEPVGRARLSPLS